MKEKDGLFRSIFTAYLILILHVFLLAGVTVVLFKGIYTYLPLIMACLGILVLFLAWIFYRQIKNNSTDITFMLSMPQFQGKTVEINFLGGLVSFKIKPDENQQSLNPLIEYPSTTQGNQLLIGNEINQIGDKLIMLNALYEKTLSLYRNLLLGKKSMKNY